MLDALRFGDPRAARRSRARDDRARRGAGHRRLRQRARRAQPRRRRGVRSRLRRQLPGQRDGGRRRPRASGSCAAACPRARRPGCSCSSASRPTRAASAAPRSPRQMLADEAAISAARCSSPDPFLKRVLTWPTRRCSRACARAECRPGFKDLGAGGIACATSELAAAGGRGVDIQLDRVASRVEPVPPEVLLCAETQERFCWVVPETFAAKLCDVYNREFALGERLPRRRRARHRARARDEPRYRVTWEGETLVDCPVCRRSPPGGACGARGAPPPAPRNGASRTSTRARSHAGALARAAAAPALACSREYLFRHYDPEVQGRTWLRPRRGRRRGGSRRIRERPLGLALARRRQSLYGAAPTREPAPRHAVAEAARNVAPAGGRPWALTDCLNFGTSRGPARDGRLRGHARGAGGRGARRSAARGLRDAPLPFVSGNVSLYNQDGSGRDPAVADRDLCAGVLDDLSRVTTPGLKRARRLPVLVGDPRGDLARLATSRAWSGGEAGGAPPLDLEREARASARRARRTRAAGWSAAHDVSDGGLVVALAEMVFASADGLGLGRRVAGPGRRSETTRPRCGVQRASRGSCSRCSRAARRGCSCARERGARGVGDPGGTGDRRAVLRARRPRPRELVGGDRRRARGLERGAGAGMGA